MRFGWTPEYGDRVRHRDGRPIFGRVLPVVTPAWRGDAWEVAVDFGGDDGIRMAWVLPDPVIPGDHTDYWVER